MARHSVREGRIVAMLAIGRAMAILPLPFLPMTSQAAPVRARGVTTVQKSVFTPIDRKTCTPVKAQADGTAYLCPGVDRFKVYLAESEGRSFVAGSTDPAKSRAARQTLSASNSPFHPPADRATAEWRFVIRDKRKVPFAMIVRYFTKQAGRTGEVLVVSRVAGAESCHIAYIDALANADAIVIARKIADEQARTFDCTKSPAVAGEQGRSPL